MRPIIATRAVVCFMSKFTKPMIVPVSPDTMPAFARPMRAMKSPIPTATAFFIPAGIALMIFSRIPKMERTMKMIPSIRTAVKASCHEHPIPKHTVNVKNALSPIPGASATGRFAQRAITRVAMADEIAVAVNTAGNVIPLPTALSIPGFTARM